MKWAKAVVGTPTLRVGYRFYLSYYLSYFPSEHQPLCCKKSPTSNARRA